MVGKKGHSGRRSKASLRLAPAVARAAPTLDELRALQAELELHAPGSPYRTQHVPEVLYPKLCLLLDWLISQEPWSKFDVHLYRWYRVKEGIEHGHRLIDGSVYDDAAREVAGTPAAGGAAAMKASYEWIEKRRDAAGYISYTSTSGLFSDGLK